MWLSRIFRFCMAFSICIFIESCATSLSQEENDIKAARIHIKLGYGYIEQNNLELAKQKLTRALVLAPELPETQDAMAYLYVRLGENEKAEYHYQQALLTAPHDPKILNNYGTFLCRIGHFLDAETYFLKAIENPFYETPFEAYENAGLCALMCAEEKKQQVCYTRAEYFFKKALSYDPNRPIALAGLKKLKKDNLRGKE